MQNCHPGQLYDLILSNRVKTGCIYGVWSGEKGTSLNGPAWIWKCVDDDQLMEEAHAMAAHFARAPTKGLAATKATLYASPAHTLPEQMELERDTMRALGRSRDYREGVTAFLEKRAPQFTGQ